MRRGKRIAVLKAHVTPELKQQFELFLEDEPSTVSMSDYLFGILEEHAAMKAIRVGKQKNARRIGNS